MMEFNAGIGGLREPTAIANGPDGSLWYTADAESGGDGGIGRISPLGVVTEFTSAFDDIEPNAITAGPDGNLWFSDPELPSIGRITPQGKVTRFKLLETSKPQDIAAGPDGNLWFTDTGTPTRIGRITPTGLVTSFVVGLNPVGQPAGIAAGPDGNLWFAERAGGGRIGRVTPLGVITEYAAGLTQGTEPRDIAAGPDGNLWFTAGPGVSRIGRITPGGVITEFAAGLSSAKPFNITAGPDGNLWFTAQGDPDAIGRITPAGAISLFSRGLDDDSKVQGIAAGPDAAVWFTEYGADLIGRLDPALVDAAATAPAAGAGPAHGSGLVLPPGTVPPAIGRSMVVEVLSGRVLVRRPGGRSVRLTTGATIPVNSVLDTRAGRLRLSTAMPGAGKFQSADLWGGSFAVRQARDGMTDLFLRDAPQGCAVRRGAFAKAARRRPGLWARDRRGRYRTHGRNSVATVRGTAWRTTERCDGTLTTVTQGAVSVRDLRRHRTILVRAGHSYLARR
jgi:streptogramin lyase